MTAAAVITCSDSVAAGRHADESGALAVAALRDLGFAADGPVALPDEAAAIAAAVRTAIADGARIVVTNGGTGLGPRDVTVDAVTGIGGVIIPGIGEAIRAASRERVPTSDLSRTAAYRVGTALVLCLPGSPGGVADGMAVAGPLLVHAVAIMNGGGHAAHGSGDGSAHGGGDGSAHPAGHHGITRATAHVTDAPIDLAALVARVADDAAGAVVTFEGRVRNSDLGRDVVALEYEAHPSAHGALAGLVDQALSRPRVVAAAAAHRTGPLAVGDLAFAAVVSAPHRQQAFDALMWLVDEVKAELPMWKHQRFADGTTEWVNSP